MPRLLIFAPSEKVLDTKDGSTSLIGLLFGAEFETTVAPGATPEDLKGIGLPITWAIFALWQKESEDEGKIFEQVCQIVSPSGKILLDTPVRIEMRAPLHRVVLNVHSFPVAEPGIYTIKLFLRQAGLTETGMELASASVTIKHKTPSLTSGVG